MKHFYRTRNHFVETVKFRRIKQQKGKYTAQFVLRLKQVAAYCEYDEFPDRMFIEQLLHGLEALDEFAYSFEATRKTAREINTGASSTYPGTTSKLGYEKPRNKKFSQPRYRLPPFHRKQHENQTNSTGGSSFYNSSGGQHLRG